MAFLFQAFTARKMRISVSGAGVGVGVRVGCTISNGSFSTWQSLSDNEGFLGGWTSWSQQLLWPLATTHHTKANLNIYHRSPPPSKTQYFIVKWGFHYSNAPCLKQMQNNLFHWSVLLELDVRERDGKTRMAKYSHFQVYCCCNSCIFNLLPLEVVDFNHFQHITCQSQYVSWIRPVLQ